MVALVEVLRYDDRQNYHEQDDDKYYRSIHTLYLLFNSLEISGSQNHPSGCSSFSASPIAVIGKTAANIAFFLETTIFFGIFFTISAKKLAKYKKNTYFCKKITLKTER